MIARLEDVVECRRVDVNSAADAFSTTPMMDGGFGCPPLLRELRTHPCVGEHDTWQDLQNLGQIRRLLNYLDACTILSAARRLESRTAADFTVLGGRTIKSTPDG